MKKEVKGPWKKQFDYRYLAGEDLLKEATLTISKVGIDEAFNSQKMTNEDVLVASFKETPKMIVLNKTNCKMIAKLTGSQNIEDWIGTKVTLAGIPDSRHGHVVRVKEDLSGYKV